MHGTYLASDDLTSVLANYQAFAAKMENLDMLVGGCVSIEQLMESVAQGKTADDNVLLRSAFDRGICVAAPFQDESAQHFRCVVYEPCHKTVYILDSLNVRSVKLTRLVAMLNSLAVPEGWSVQRIRTGGQNDGWSCGLWSLYTVMLTGRYVLEAQHADVRLDQYIFTALANEGLNDKTTGDRFLHVYFRHLKDAVANEQPVYAFDFNPHQHLLRLQMIADKVPVNVKRDEKHEGGRTYAEAAKCALPKCTVKQDVVHFAGKKRRLIARVDHKVRDKIIAVETGAAVKESTTCCEDVAVEIKCENAGMEWKAATERACEAVTAECETVPTSNPFGCLAETTSDETETISGTTSGESRPDMKKAVDISVIIAEVVARLGVDHCKLREI